MAPTSSACPRCKSNHRGECDAAKAIYNRRWREEELNLIEVGVSKYFNTPTEMNRYHDISQAEYYALARINNRNAAQRSQVSKIPYPVSDFEVACKMIDKERTSSAKRPINTTGQSSRSRESTVATVQAAAKPPLPTLPVPRTSDSPVNENAPTFTGYAVPAEIMFANIAAGRGPEFYARYVHHRFSKSRQTALKLAEGDTATAAAAATQGTATAQSNASVAHHWGRNPFLRDDPDEEMADTPEHALRPAADADKPDCKGKGRQF